MSRPFRGGAGFARPENALKRSDELEAIGQKAAALQTLHDVVCSKKHRTWSKTFEAIMMRHVELCVDMKKRNYAKEALLQYRNMCHQVNIGSLEEVIKHFLKRAADKAEEAQAKAAAVTLDVEDLEEDASPEELMLSYVSGEKNKDRTDRELVTPWFRFLWESYRSVLEILRTNPKLEPLYAMTATKAFHFCLQYKRTTEFKRLCDILRQHLTNLVNKFRDQRDAGPESMTMHLESRFEQLRVACELELWGEAFRSVEDIQQLIALTKKTPKQPQLASYYTRLTQIFAVSDSPLYHAFAWLKLFSFSRQHARGLAQSDYQQMGTAVMLAALAILPYDRPAPGARPAGAAASDAVVAEQEKERANRMATILGFAVDAKKDARGLLTRSSLLATITSSNMLALVPPEVRAIHDALSQDFNPLELCQRLAPLLEKLPELSSAQLSATAPVRTVALDKYVPALKQAAVLRLLKQLSEVYSVMRISELAALVPFYTFAEVEAVVVDAVKHDYLQMRVDHRNGTLHFGSQQVESDKIRGHLSSIAKRLAKAVAMMAGPGTEVARSAAEVAQKEAIIKAARETLEGEHLKAVARKMAIERKKEEAERALFEAEQMEAQRKAQAQRAHELAEDRRRKEEAARRETERLQREMEEREQEELRAHLGARNIKVKEGEKLEKNTVIKDLMSERLKEQQEMERRLARTAKNLDHLERARREEEAPFLEAAWKQRQEADRAYWETAQAQAAELHRKAWEVDIEEKKRLAYMVADKDVFKGIIMQRREAEFQALRRERERRMAEMRQQHKYEREIARRKAYVTRCRQEVENRVRDMEEQQRREEEARKKAEEAERQRKLDEALAKQRAREEEIERRKAEERAALVSGGGGAAAAGAAAAPAAGGSRFVPPHLRRQMEAGGSAPAPAPAAAAPAAAAAEESGDRWARRGPEAPPAEDRWGRRDAPPPAEDRWGRRDAAPPTREYDRPRDSAPPASSGSAPGKFVPPALRNRQEGAAPPSGSAPPPSGGGGAYRPPNRR